ncbi:hypothetical protein [Nocardia anaemiae]|uniref:hypothetical protein n=1 Tax=Nocardia anaemiae TaxID=263910 RepID=UPI000B252912|nr:hypothetical protein [Nocardia anaemiae]
MKSTKIRAAVATAALAPMIALGSGIATADPAPANPPAPVQVAPASEQLPQAADPALLWWNPFLWWVCFIPPIFPFGTGICLV